MSELSGLDSTHRFTGLAGLYARCRPGYPPAAFDFLTAHCGLGPGALVIDVGCGTGIAAQLAAARGLRVIGIEPNADMRARAEAERLPPELPTPTYREGRAEATGLPAETADAVLAAQAFHWFEPAAALQEFHRILKPGGWVVLLGNERDESDPFTAAYGTVVRTHCEAAALELSRGQAGEILLATALFRNGQRVFFRNEQSLDEEGLLGRAFSVSYAPRPPARAEAFAAALRAVFARFQRAGQVVLHYQTSVIVAQHFRDESLVDIRK